MIARCLLNIEIINLQPMNVKDQNFRRSVLCMTCSFKTGWPLVGNEGMKPYMVMMGFFVKMDHFLLNYHFLEGRVCPYHPWEWHISLHEW